MSTNQSKIFRNKVSLIYEFNKSSPLFVRMAKIEIDENNLERAVEILNNGLKLFPQYPTAYFILGRAFTLTGKYSEAKKAFENGSKLINSKKTFEYYLLELENLRKRRPLFEFNKKNPFLRENDIAANKNLPNGNTYNKVQPIKEDDDSFSANSKKFSDDDMIVSETIAKIYVAQGEINEAIKVYEKLRKNDPLQNDYYLKKISELKSELND